jgi:chondroitin AC lyase
MKKTILILIAGFLLNLNAKADDFDIMYNNLYAKYVAYGCSSDATIQGFMDTQQSNGSWSDIDYTSNPSNGGSWIPGKHIFHLQDMVRCYKKSSSTINKANLLAKIKLGLTYWYGLNPQPISSDWYDMDIRIPLVFNEMLILLKNEFTNPSTDWNTYIVTGCTNYLALPKTGATATSYKMTNYNGTCIGLLLVHNGIIQKNATTLQSGITLIQNQISVVGKTTEGTQVDNSYLVHGIQVYNGGYGIGFISGCTDAMSFTTGCSKQYFSTASINVLRDLILKGDQWMIFGDQYDFGTRGRQITSPSQAAATGLTGVVEVCNEMKALDPTNATAYQNFINHINSPHSNDDVIGNKFFYRGDFMTHRRSGSYIGVKMCSVRTTGTECMQMQGLKNFWIPFGATCIMTNAREYNTIYPYWDWCKIPGVTCPAVVISWPMNNTTTYNSTQTSYLVGGVSEGTYGLAAMDYLQNTAGQSGITVSADIKAKKSWFMFDDETVALGAGITSAYTSAVTTTTLDQSAKQGNVTVDGTIASATEKVYPGVRWVHHNNIGYVFRTPTDINLKTNSQSGSWYSILGSGSTSTISTNIFKFWLDHGTAPTNATYEYSILPNKTVDKMSNYAANMPTTIISNTTLLQAVKHNTLNLAGAVFFDKTATYTDGGLKVTVDKPCALLIDQSVNPIKVTIADMSQYLTSLTVTLSYNGTKSEQLVFTLPTGNLTGSSVSKVATIINTTGVDQTTLIREIHISPSPSNGIFNIKLDENLIGSQLTIYDNLGRKIYSKQIKTNNERIDISGKFIGMGIVNIENNGHRYSKKILIEN